MKRKMGIILIGLCVLNLIFASSILATENKIHSENTSTETKEQDIPTLNYFVIRGRPTKSGFDFEGYHNVTDIYNWTEENQQVKIRWKIINDYNYSATVTLLIRVGEWQYWTGKAFGLMPVFLWWYDRGSVSVTTPGFELFDNTDFPKFHRYPITMQPYNHSTGNMTIDLHFDRWFHNDTVQVWSKIYCREAIMFPAARGGLNILPNIP